MGRIIIEGKAKKEVNADIMRISIIFKSRANSEAKAIGKVKSECEEYLEQLKGLGVSITEVQDEGESVSYSYDEEKVTVYAEKPILLVSNLNISAANKFTEIIKESNFSASINVNYSLSREEELESELIKEAVLDSKRKAELIASSMEQKISGIEEVRDPDYYRNNSILGNPKCIGTVGEYISATPLADTLAAPVIEREEEVEVVWLIE